MRPYRFYGVDGAAMVVRRRVHLRRYSAGESCGRADLHYPATRSWRGRDRSRECGGGSRDLGGRFMAAIPMPPQPITATILRHQPTTHRRG
jgi:hypothetical protein